MNDNHMERWLTAVITGFPVVPAVKNLPAKVGNIRHMDLIPGLERYPWRRARQPTPVFLTGESHE